MTIVVTRDVADRYRGFLASVMPEIGPGIYVSPELTRSVRERVWTVLSGWWSALPGGAIILAWKDEKAPSRLGLSTLGLPPGRLADVEGVLLVHRELPIQFEDPPF